MNTTGRKVYALYTAQREHHYPYTASVLDADMARAEGEAQAKRKELAAQGHDVALRRGINEYIVTVF